VLRITMVMATAIDSEVAMARRMAIEAAMARRMGVKEQQRQRCEDGQDRGKGGKCGKSRRKCKGGMGWGH
jgi:hypothetical protein